jgi:hypothetical protein
MSNGQSEAVHAEPGDRMPLTFSEASQWYHQWYQNILTAGGCVITYRGADHTVARPVVVDRHGGAGVPPYGRLALRLIGINEFLWLADASDGAGSAVSGRENHGPFGKRSIT